MFSANMNGELTLKVETDTVSVATYFKELENHQFGMVYLLVLLGLCDSNLCDHLTIFLMLEQTEVLKEDILTIHCNHRTWVLLFPYYFFRNSLVHFNLIEAV